MNVSLTPELDAFVRGLVESGMYYSSSEVVREGLRLLKEREQLRQARLEELRRQTAIGIEQLDRGEYVSAEDVFAELRQRQTQFQQPAEDPTT